MINMIRITEFNNKDLEIYLQTSEIQLLRYSEPEPGLFIAESAKVVVRALSKGYEPVSLLIEDSAVKDEEVIKLLSILPKNTPVYIADLNTLKQIKGFNLTRGVLSVMKRRKTADVLDIVKMANKIAVLDDIENPTNIGAIFRSAAALGIDGIILTRGCSDPLYRRTIRVSMGSVFTIPWGFCDNNQYTRMLKENDYTIVAMALKESSISIKELTVKGKRAIVFGNEGFGLSEKIIDECDYSVIIPMQNGIDSLNVAAASAIAFWEL